MVFLTTGILHAQLNRGGVPPSFELDLPQYLEPVINVPRPDIGELQTEDALFPTPYRFGVVLPVNISPEFSGEWNQLPDGSRIWRATLKASGALALSAYFDRFFLPPDGKLFLYNRDKSQVLGAYTSHNNHKSGLFATELIAGDEITLEYTDQGHYKGQLQLHLNEIDYAYRGVEYLNTNEDQGGSVSPCEVDVKCPEGDNWQKQIKGVVRIMIKRTGHSFWCSGSLVNNTKNDGAPYILTANHCAFNSTEQDVSQWIFYFNYEAPSCNSNALPSGIKSLTGAVKCAQSGSTQTSGSDFYLVKMTDTIPDSIHTFYNGWNLDPAASPSGVGIHHPNGGTKKISTYVSALSSTSWMGNPDETHWQVVWVATQSGHGVTEGGSSGSPIFDNLGYIIGTLSSGASACDSASLNLADFYGKFTWSWISNGNDSTSQLRPWLDPGNTGVTKLNGISIIHQDTTIVQRSFKVGPIPFTDHLNIELEGIAGTRFHISLFDLLGNSVHLEQQDFNLGSLGIITLPVYGLPAGIYFIRVETTGSTLIRKVFRY